MVSLLRTEARRRQWTDGDILEPLLPTMQSTSSKGKLDKHESVSTTLPSLRPKTSQGPEYSTSAGSYEELLQSTRPSTSPGAINKGGLGETKHEDDNKTHELDERPIKTNPFDEFTSSADIEELTRKRMMLEDRAQAFAIASFQHQSAYLRSDLKTRSNEELFENRVVFSRGAMAVMEAEQKEPVEKMLKTLSAEHMGKVTEGMRELRSSHKKVNESNKDLELLNLVAEQVRGKLTKNSEGGVSVEKVDGSLVKNVLASLYHEERLELNMLGIGKEQLDHLCQFYVRVHSSHRVDKDRLRRTLVKAMAKGATFSKERFEDLWKTLLPFGASDVSFMDLARWTTKYLPVKSLADEDETSKKQAVSTSRPSFRSAFQLGGASKPRDSMRESVVGGKRATKTTEEYKHNMREVIIG
jgi:hypothetical protein